MGYIVCFCGERKYSNNQVSKQPMFLLLPSDPKIGEEEDSLDGNNCVDAESSVGVAWDSFASSNFG